MSPGERGPRSDAAAGWELLPTLVVRSAAFPWEMAADIACPGAGALADEVAGLEAEARDLLAEPPPAAGRPNRGTLSRLRNLRPLPPGTPVRDDWLAAWNATTSRLELSRRRLAGLVEAEGTLTRDAFDQVASDGRFLDAVVCSSPGVYRDLRRGRPGARLRRQIASYVQRFCAKCETMSFFGPINYGRVDPAGTTGFAWSGHRECPRRTAFPAARVLDGLVDRVLKDPALLAGLVARRKTWTAEPRGGVVGQCDGARTVAEIARAAGRGVEQTAAEVAAAVRRGLLTHDLCPPATVPDALGWLRERLRAREDPGAPATPLAQTADGLAALLGGYPAASPDEKLSVQARVAELAGGDTGKGTGGRFYNDRVIVHEAAVGTLRVTVGGPLAADLAGLVPRALAPLAEDAEQTRRLTGALLAERLGRGVFRLSDVLRTGAGLRVRYGDHLTRRVAEILRDAAPGTTSVDLAGRLDDPAPPSVPVLCSVDVMVAAADLAEYRPGRTPLVLGDIHDAALLTPWALQFHPGAPQAIEERDGAIERALTGHTALNVIARRRTGLPPLQFPGPVLELGGTSADPGRGRIGLDRLEVHSDGERVTLRAEGAGEPLLFHNGELETAVHTALALPRVRRPRLPDLPYVPRLTWGNVVLSRRCWRLEESETATLADAAGDCGRLTAMARLRAARGLPARFFASSAGERKPVYVDAHSPALLDGLLRLARTAERITVSEALPGPPESWLRDGPYRFAAELRCVYLRGAG
ncbi:lantibiotic dehydratase [Actinomadura graeca]|uniref:lantibiotic dehydratase n=1 Tax=Actinomadura graeca TaxID=2750812 RepID=UPI001E40F4F6|nr:lantibiotic dehydratase [Actinomadura graeca]